MRCLSLVSLLRIFFDGVCFAKKLCRLRRRMLTALITFTGFGDLLVECGSNDLGGESSQSDSLLTHVTGGLSKSQWQIL